MARRLLVAAFMVAIMASPALAKGGPSGGSSKTSDPSIAVNQANPYLGEVVTYTVSYPSSDKNPRVQVMCYQGGVMVYGEAEAVGVPFTLGGGSSQWLTNGGPASCEADLYNLVWNGNQMQQVTMLASTYFDAAGAPA